MLILNKITYIHPDRDVLFTDIDLVINKHDKVALVGNNGAGKSTLLKILSGTLAASSGTRRVDAIPYYVPQLFGQFNNQSVVEALGVDSKLSALRQILNGNTADEYFAVLNDDWTIEERCQVAFAEWNLDDVLLMQKMDTLSGGQKAKIFLAGITIHKPEIVLLDEPSNHLDMFSRKLLYDYVVSTTSTLVVVSHDRKLLNLLPSVLELSKRNITTYGGNYDFYAAQKAIERNALGEEMRNKEKALRKAKETERETLERKQKLDARGRKKQEKSGLPTISMNTLRNNAERSTSRMKGVHDEKIVTLSNDLDQIRKGQPDTDKMKIGFSVPSIHAGKILVKAEEINFGYNDRLLWKQGLSFQICSGVRVVLKGPNGAGKTTLIKMILGELKPFAGSLYRAEMTAIYIDQDYSLIDNSLTVYEQVQQFNTGVLQEHEIKIRLARFLFTSEYWDKRCGTLSGGEKMRLMLCCLTIANKAPDMIVLDEPTNNLDIQSAEILTTAINEYKGTLVVVSHDEYFLEQVNVIDAIVV